MKTHKQIVAKMKEVRDEILRLHEKAEKADDGLSEEDETYFVELQGEFEELDTQRKKMEREAAVARVKELAGDPRNLLSGDGALQPELDRHLEADPDSPEARRYRDPWDLSEVRAYGANPAGHSHELRSRSLTAIERMSVTDDKRREAMSRLIERHDTRDGRIARLCLATSSDAYVRAFGKLMSHEGNMGVLDAEEQASVNRAMSLTDNAGGYLVPFQLDPSVILTADGSFNQVRQIARKVTATGDVWNGVSSAGVTGSWDAEAAEVSDDAPTLAQPSIPVHKLAIFVPISIEALADAQNVAQEVGEMIAFEKDRLESVAFISGSGSGQPTGIITALNGGSSEIAAATADTFVLADLYGLDSALPARYRARASWLAHRTTYNDIRQFDTSGGAALWERLGADVPPLLLGKGAYEAEAMETVGQTATAGNDEFLVFGDFMNYVIADRLGTTVEFIPHLFHTGNNRPSGQRGWYAYARVGADSVNDGAFRVLAA